MREAAKPNTLALIGFTGAILVGAPLAGIWIAGLSIEPYLELPPRPVQVGVLGFSWTVFWAMAGFVVGAVAPFVWRFVQRGKGGRSPRHHFPAWGWAVVVWLAASWALAWTRFSWLEPFQSHTFTPLWVGYIGVVNALTVRRAGSSLLTRDPMRFCMLFPLSALFWWFFEYLNRFVGNWRYVGIEDFGPVEYAFFATLAFSTVLPAVVSTAEYLGTFQRLDAAFASWFPVRLPRPKLAAALVLVITTLSLTGLAVFREYLYPLLWISPLLVIVSIQALSGRATVLTPLASGDWHGVVNYAIAALLCGFFWEMWNYGSLSHWEYSIAYVDRFRIFEMPLLGYAGYLPFGIECAAIAALVLSPSVGAAGERPGDVLAHER
jgi:hypothetical protein